MWTPLVLDALGEVGARATFFVIAPFAEFRPELLVRMTRAGHEVAFHCVEHRRHDGLAIDEIMADARGGLDVLERLSVEARYWRVPWGFVTPDTGRVAAELGLRLVGWTADSEDWRGDRPGTMLARMEHGLEDGAILLMHDGLGPGATRTGCAETVALIRPLVESLASRELEPVPVGELEGAVPDRNPRGFAGV